MPHSAREVRLGLASLLALSAPALAQTPLPCLFDEAKLLAGDGAAGDLFGVAVAVDGDTALVGAGRADAIGVDSGAAYVYVRQGASWVQQAKLTPDDAAAGQRFGSAVAIAGDTIVVGAQGDGHAGVYTGAAYVFARSGASWTQTARLESDDAAAGDLFGWSVAVDGATALVGALGDDDAGDFSGAAYVFVEEGAGWSQQAKLVAGDAQANDWLGHGVALDGDTALVGANREDEAGANAGAAYVFVRAGASWSEQAKLVALDGEELDFAGGSVALDGDTALVGAFGGNDDGPYSGSAYVYVRAGARWSQQAKLIADDGRVDDFFGHAVALEGQLALIGAYGDDDAGLDAGSVYLFERSAAGWELRERVEAPDPQPRDFYGAALAMRGGTALVGAVQEDELGADAGAAYALAPPGPAGELYCTCAAGPCGNDDAGAGCANSTGAGARLEARGRTDPDALNLVASGATPNQFAILFQADDAAAAVFGDGLRCAAGNVQRITKPAVLIGADGALAYGPCFGDEPISAVTGVVPGSGETKRYQLWYRDPSGPCGATFNLSNGLAVTW